MNPIYYTSVNAMMVEANAFQQQHQQHTSSQTAIAASSTSGYSSDEHHAAMIRAMALQAVQEAPPSFHDAVRAGPPPAYSRQTRRSDENSITSGEQHTGPHVTDAKNPSAGATEQRDISLPPVLLELCVGHKLAAKMTQKRAQRRAARLEEVHDAWAALGLDTRMLVATNGNLPPHFWNPPLCTAEEWSRRLEECF